MCIVEVLYANVACYDIYKDLEGNNSNLVLSACQNNMHISVRY